MSDLYDASIDPRDPRYSAYRHETHEGVEPFEASEVPGAAEGRLIKLSSSEAERTSSDEDKKLTAVDIRARIQQTHDGIRAIKAIPSVAATKETAATLRILAERIIKLEKELANRPHAELLMELMESEPISGEASGKPKEQSKSRTQEKESAAPRHAHDTSVEAGTAPALGKPPGFVTAPVAEGRKANTVWDFDPADVSVQESEDREEVETHRGQQQPTQFPTGMTQGVIEPKGYTGAHPTHPRASVGPRGDIVGEHQLPGVEYRARTGASHNAMASQTATALSSAQVPGGSTERNVHSGKQATRGRKPAQKIVPWLQELMNQPASQDPGEGARNQYVRNEDS